MMIASWTGWKGKTNALTDASEDMIIFLNLNLFAFVLLLTLTDWINNLSTLIK
jgi:hypothetical protein